MKGKGKSKRAQCLVCDSIYDSMDDVVMVIDSGLENCSLLANDITKAGAHFSFY